MKKSAIRSVSLMMFLGVILSPSKSNATMTFDPLATLLSSKALTETVGQTSRIKDAIKIASDINNSVGKATKSISQLGIEQAQKIKDKKDKLEKENERYKKLQEEIDARKKDYEKAKTEIEDAKKEAEKYKQEAENAKNKAKDTVNDAKDKVDSAKDTVNDAKDKVDSAKDKVDSAKETASSARDKINSGNTSGQDSSGSSSGRKPFDGSRPISRPAVDASISSPVTRPAIDTNNDSPSQDSSSQDSVQDAEEASTNETSSDESNVVTENPKDDADSSNVAEKNSNSDKYLNYDANVEAEKEALDKMKSRVKTQGRKPFGKTSSYKSSETFAFAQSLPKTDKVSNGVTPDGKFIFSKELAFECGLNTDDLLDTKNMVNCLTKLLTDMSHENAGVAADGQRKYSIALREQVIGSLAEIMRINNEAAQFDDKVLEPLRNQLASATNTRDDISGVAQSIVAGTQAENNTTLALSYYLGVDALRLLGYFNISDLGEEGASKANSEQTPSANETPKAEENDKT